MTKIKHSTLAVIITLSIPLAILLTGCLISEHDEYRIIINADNKSGVITIIKQNIQSNQIDPAKQQEDFDNLMRDWKDDQYLIEKTKLGIYVKERNLSIVKGKLVWKEVALFSDLQNLFRDAIQNDTLQIGFGKDETVVMTNGELTQTKDSAFVRWPLTAKELILKTQKNSFSTASNFVEKFKIYTKKKK